jgi:ectoine hydroxylase-related dioxygenase (phytanoyl-CoA dioxygenase family)
VYDGGVDILAPAGSVMFFHALLVHNSRSNTSGHPRRIMIYSPYPARVDMGDDVRNGPGRHREQPYEQQYREMVARGEFVPVFRVAR